MSAHQLAYVEWCSTGKVCRMIREVPMHEDLGVLDQLVVKMDRPHRLKQYDVNWCERDACYYFNYSGSWTGRLYINRKIPGHRSKIWTLPHIQLCGDGLDDDKRMLTPAEITERGYDFVGDEELSGAPTFIDEDIGCSWCTVCGDMLPDNELCPHMHYCDGAIWGPEDGECPSGEECDLVRYAE